MRLLRGRHNGHFSLRDDAKNQRSKAFNFVKMRLTRAARDLGFQCQAWLTCHTHHTSDGFKNLYRRKGQSMSLLHSVKRFVVSEDGPTAVEYAVMLALIVVVCLTAIQAVGTNANNKFNAVKNALT
jgi:pilus assembly protein Flp/PilA